MNASLQEKTHKPPDTSPIARRGAPRKAARYTTRTAYNRKEQLPRLIGLWPHEVEDYSEAASERIVALLQKALRSERQRGIGGHWTYDVNRHLALKEALSEETERLRIVKGLAAVRALPPASTKRTEPAATSGNRPRAKILHLPFGEAAPTPTRNSDAK